MIYPRFFHGVPTSSLFSFPRYVPLPRRWKTCLLKRNPRSWPLRHDPMGRGHPVYRQSFNVWGRGCKRCPCWKKGILTSSEVKKRQSERRKWAFEQLYLQQGLHFAFGGWTLDFPDASISLAVEDKVHQVCLKLLDSQLWEWRGCWWTATGR